MRELNFNKECSSSYICKYYGAFIDIQSATISIAMEFCEGGSLDSIYRMVKSRGGRTGEKVLGKIAEGVLEGLTYLSGRKIIHRGSWTILHSYILSKPLTALYRYQAFKHSALQEWTGQAVRLWCLWRASWVKR